ncbi:uncharacterized protein LOC118435003 [Folsomia candida]|uniref:uncharacterized protein LOC118435003 n=1 Tax=Folsomia candida TaxID=158441 RepID=UPI001604AE49|nr:uncharacterized protein LOC118435003 [Folsomia candida]
MSKFEGFSSIQRKIINTFSYCPISLTTVEHLDKGGHFRLVSASWWRIMFYIAFNLNTLVKLIYLVLLVLGCFGPVNFLDKISALLWILICLELLQELIFWVNKYPIFEVLSNLWKVENKIFMRLGRPMILKQKCDKINYSTLLIHGGILIIGCVLLGAQFIYSPKYSVYTYAAFEHENDFLLAVFTCHEVFFMYNAWNGYLSIVILSSVNAVELSGILEGMTSYLLSQSVSLSCDIETALTQDLNQCIIGASNNNNKIEGNRKNITDLGAVCTNSSYYNVYDVIADYKKLMLASDLLNSWCSYRIIGIHTIGYSQFITDVFIMIQLAKLPNTDWSAVMWFGEDAMVCIFMIFRMFSLMARVAPASENFMRQATECLSVDALHRKRNKKVAKTMRLVALKLGPCPVRPSSVGSSVMMLMNYYLCVALWK